MTTPNKPTVGVQVKLSVECVASSLQMLSQEEPEGAETPPYHVQGAWQQSIEARGIVNNLLKRNKRRIFGKPCNHAYFEEMFKSLWYTIGSCMYPLFVLGLHCTAWWYKNDILVSLNIDVNKPCNRSPWYYYRFCIIWFWHAGLLEKPGFDRRIPVLRKRLFLVGKSGVGKTSTIHKLMGRGK